jgi:hypothetical protein
MFTATCLHCTGSIVTAPILRDAEIRVLREHAHVCVRELDADTVGLADLLKLFGVTMAEQT